MKQIILILAISILCLSLLAQTGLLELNYGQNLNEIKELLEQRGFVQSPTDSTVFNGEMYTVNTELRLYFETDKTNLLGWLIAIEVGDLDEYEVETVFIEDVCMLHGDDYEYDPDFNEAYWRLDDYHFINSGFDSEYDYYLIFYGDNRHQEISPW